MTDNLPEPDDAPWLNLSQEEINQLRYNKQELTEYGREKIRELMEEYHKQNRKPTLYELLEEWVDYGNFAKSKDVIVNEILNVVKSWLPPQYETNDYQWNRCIQLMKDKLR
jgi:hypothetical protein